MNELSRAAVCPVGVAQTRGAATTDGYQLFHKESCTDFSQCQLCMEKCVLTSVSVVFYWVLEKCCICVCTSKSVQGGARSYIGSCKPPITIWKNSHMDQKAGGGGISGMHLGLFLLLPEHLAALSHYRGTALSPHRHYGSGESSDSSITDEMLPSLSFKKCYILLLI